MNSVTIEHEDLLELNRMMYTLFKYFTVLCEKTKESSLVPFRTSDQIHLDMHPEDFYEVIGGSSSVRLHRVRTHYTLHYCGFNTKVFKPYRPSSDFKYENYYGDFTTFTTAISGLLHQLPDLCYIQKKLVLLLFQSSLLQ